MKYKYFILKREVERAEIQTYFQNSPQLTKEIDKDMQKNI